MKFLRPSTGCKCFDFHQMIPIFLKIFGLFQGAREPRGGDLQDVGIGDEVANLQNRPQLPAHFGAVVDIDPPLAVNIDAQNPPRRFPLILHIHQLQALRLEGRVPRLGVFLPIAGSNFRKFPLYEKKMGPKEPTFCKQTFKKPPFSPNCKPFLFLMG